MNHKYTVKIKMEIMNNQVVDSYCSPTNNETHSEFDRGLNERDVRQCMI